MEVKKDIMWRIYLIFFVFCLFGLAIIVQIFRIQFVQGHYWKSKIDSLTTQIKSIEASRGNIFSSDGSLLATSVPIYEIRMDMQIEGLSNNVFNSNLDSLSFCLANLFRDKSKADFKQNLRQAYANKERYHLVQRNVSYADLQKAKRFPLFRLGKYKGGLIVEQKNMRELPFKQLAARTIGYMRDVKPVGIEAAFEDDLEGASGKRLMQRIAGGVWMPLNDKEEVEPKNGNDVISTIDINIQDVAESSLEKHLRMHNADHGCVAVMEVATGEIKAIANLSRNSNGNYVEKFNYVIAEATEPGSTMKLASLLSVMNDGLVDVNDTVNVGDGTYYYFGQRMKDSHSPKKSRLSVKEAFITSSNVGISKIIYQNYSKNPQDFINNLKSFGLNVPLGLQIEGEGKPRIKDTNAKDWSPVSLPWIAIGYEVKLTPLQILTLYNAIANNGRMVRPKFIREVRNHGQLVKAFPIEIIKDSIVSPSTIVKARELLEAVVDNGTAGILHNPYYKVAGKTGTAQIFQNKFGYDKTHMTYQASFVGYFPADNPKYSAIVVVYAPSSDVYYGGAVAAPVFKEIADKIYSNRIDLHYTITKVDSAFHEFPKIKAGQQKDLNKVISKLKIDSDYRSVDALWVSPKIANKRVTINERSMQNGMVPNVVGMGVRDALFLLENSGLNVQVNGKGIVTRQSLNPGIKIQKGQQIVIELS